MYNRILRASSSRRLFTNDVRGYYDEEPRPPQFSDLSRSLGRLTGLVVVVALDRQETKIIRSSKPIRTEKSMRPVAHDTPSADPSPSILRFSLRCASTILSRRDSRYHRNPAYRSVTIFHTSKSGVSLCGAGRNRQQQR